VHACTASKKHNDVTVRHAQFRIERAYLFESPLTNRKAKNALFQFGDIAVHLCVASLPARVVDDFTHIRFPPRRSKQPYRVKCGGFFQTFLIKNLTKTLGGHFSCRPLVDMRT